MACDDSGIVYTTGSFRDEVDFDPGPGVDIIDSNGESDTFLNIFTSNGTHITTLTWGGEYFENGWDIEIDTNNSIFVTGYYSSTTDFDPGTGEEKHSPIGSADIFLSKFNSDWDFEWVRTWGSGFSDWGLSVLPTNSGDIYLTGFFSDSADLDPGIDEDTHNSAGNTDGFLIKMLSNGYWE